MNQPSQTFPQTPPTPHQARELATSQKQLQKLNKEIETAEVRRTQAETVAANLESRNRSSIASLQTELDETRRIFEAKLDLDKVELEAQIKRLKEVKSYLIEEVWAAEERKSELLIKIEDLTQNYDLIASDIAVHEQALTTILEEIETKKQELSEVEASSKKRTDDLIKDIRELEAAKSEIAEDLVMLEAEAKDTQDSIVALDDHYKAVKAELDAKLSVTQTKLNNALKLLQNAQDKDKQTREWLADQLIKLDKREKVVAKREARVNQGEARLQQEDDFNKL